MPEFELRLVAIGAFGALLLGLSLFLVFSPVSAANNAMSPWVVYYSDQAVPLEFEPYKLVVLDSEHHPSLQALQERGKTLLGYVSLGEAEQYRAWFDDVKDEGLLLQENKDWPGSFYVDLRDPRWTRRVIEDLVPHILRQGFDGLFLDTLDNPAELERQDPVRFAGMTEAAAQLVRSIRRHYPRIKIMLNRAYEILPAVATHIDMELGESVYADYDFENHRNGLVEAELYREQVDMLKAAQKISPDLDIFTLDYWDPEDTAGIASIYREQRKNGFIPYVATVELDRIVTEPGLSNPVEPVIERNR